MIDEVNYTHYIDMESSNSLAFTQTVAGELEFAESESTSIVTVL